MVLSFLIFSATCGKSEQQIWIECNGNPLNDDDVAIFTLSHDMLKTRRDDLSPPRQIEIDRDVKYRMSNKGAVNVDVRTVAWPMQRSCPHAR